jgi:hypothetical protein
MFIRLPRILEHLKHAYDGDGSKIQLDPAVHILEVADELKALMREIPKGKHERTLQRYVLIVKRRRDVRDRGIPSIWKFLTNERKWSLDPRTISSLETEAIARGLLPARRTQLK